MRDAMPQVAAWVDQLRQVLGADVIDHALRTQRFVASEVGPDGRRHVVERNLQAQPAMVVTRRAWGCRA